MMITVVVETTVIVASVVGAIVVAARWAMSARILVEAHLGFLGVGVLVGSSDHLTDACGRLAAEFGAKLMMVESSDEGGDDLNFSDVGNRVAHLEKASNVAVEELGRLLVDAVEITLGARSGTRGHIVVGEDFLQLFLGSDGVRGKASKPAHGGWHEHDGEIIRHDTSVSSGGTDISGICLQPLCPIHPSFVGLDPSDLKSTGPPKCLESPCESLRPLRVVDPVVCSVAISDRLEG